jgi:hypothetical protein
MSGVPDPHEGSGTPAPVKGSTDGRSLTPPVA